jgi:hypothetical protein
MNIDGSKLLCPCGVTELGGLRMQDGGRQTRVWKYMELKGFTIFLMRKCMQFKPHIGEPNIPIIHQ